MKAPKKFRNRSRESPLRCNSTKKWKFLIFLGPHSQPSAPNNVKFCNRCNESPLEGEKPDFWPVSKFITGSLPLCGNPAGKNNERWYYFRSTL